MRKVTITRTETDDSGTFGLWQSDSGFQCYTGELPNLKNVPGKSCIPAGSYQAAIRASVKHGKCYGINGVKGRSDIEVHSGNFCGNVDKGIKSDVLGCIILGNSIGEIGGQKCVMSSKDALARAVSDLDGEAFNLTIEWA